MSGSHTAATSKLSEGASYVATAEYFEWWGHPEVKGRCRSAEGYDTRDNLIYGIASAQIWGIGLIKLYNFTAGTLWGSRLIGHVWRAKR
jgi:hypothetical protein